MEYFIFGIKHVQKKEKLVNIHTNYMCAHSMSTNASMSQWKFVRRLGMCILLASVGSASHSLAGFAHVRYNTLTLYLACILTHCVACT